MERTIEVINDEISELQDKINALRDERSKIKRGKYNFVGKFIKFKTPLYGDDCFMYVYEMFPVEHERMCIRGVSFEHEMSEYWDGSYFSWQTDCDKVIDIDQLSTIIEITEEEYNQVFEEILTKFLKHKKDYVDKHMKDWAED